ncbi:MAG: ComEC/Rec2 family competence protein, partial [Candidatus Uhrbacteria bacterium]|nr:ComEC/Rec2 family competence protein [Candidatus Uhrbacteria bacterium]
VLSTVGLISLTPLVTRRLRFVPETLGLREALASTFAATLATLPLLVIAFGQISFVAPLANLLVLPLVPFVMLSGALAGAVGTLLPAVGAVAALPAWLGLGAQLSMIEALASLPFALLTIQHGVWFVAFVLLVVVALLVRWLRRSPIASLESAMPAWATMSGAAVIVLALVIARQIHVSADASLTVWVFDVGQGDAIYIDGPERDILIDGGPSNVVLQKLTEVLAPWDRSLAAVLLTHGDADHVTGLNDVVRRYDVETVYTNGALHHGALANAFFDAVDQTYVATDDVIDLGGGVVLHVLWPDASTQGVASDDPNDQSVVTLLTYGDTTMLLTGDSSSLVESAIDVGHVDVLKVGHHGSETSTSQTLLENISPDVAIISVGADNDYGHPGPFMLDRLFRADITVYRTDRDGDVRVQSDGGEPTVEPVRLW